MIAGKGIGKPEGLRGALVRERPEEVTLPKSKLKVRLCRPPSLAVLGMAHEGQEIWEKVTKVKLEGVRSEDLYAFADWIIAALSQVFVQPVFSRAPKPGEIGLGDLLQDDLIFIFHWLWRGIFPTVTGLEDLAQFHGQPGIALLPRGGSWVQ
jgi:hypothetical protein